MARLVGFVGLVTSVAGRWLAERCPLSPRPTMVVVDDCGCGRLLMLLLSPASPFPPLPLPISPPPPPTPSEPGWVEGWRWVMMVGRLWFVGCDNQWTTYNLLPTTYNLRPTTYYLQLTTYYLRPTTYYRKRL